MHGIRVKGDERYQAWTESVGRVFPELTITPTTSAPMAGHLKAVMCGAVKGVELAGAGHLLDRSATQIRRSPAEHPYICWQRGETLTIAHGKGTDVLSHGGFVIHDSNRPHRLVMDRPFDLICVQVPDLLVRERSGASVMEHVGRLPSFSAGMSRIMAASAGALMDAHATSQDEVAVGDLFLEVLGRALAQLDRVERGITAATGTRIERLQRFIAANFRQEGLSPSDAAAELGWSLRQVHATTALTGTTFGKMLLNARLSAARLALDGAGNAEAGRISNVAYASGFSDVSHFSRAFRARFGVSPRAIGAPAGERSVHLPDRQKSH